jgi:hypothetical protein
MGTHFCRPGIKGNECEADKNNKNTKVGIRALALYNNHNVYRTSIHGGINECHTYPLSPIRTGNSTQMAGEQVSDYTLIAAVNHDKEDVKSLAV